MGHLRCAPFHQFLRPSSRPRRRLEATARRRRRRLFLARRVSRSSSFSSFFSSSSSSSSSSKVLRHASGIQNRRRRHHRQNTFAGLQSSSDTANEGIETNDETEEDAPWAKPGYKGAWVSQQDNQTQILVVTAIWVGLILSTYLSCAKVGPIVESILPDGIFQLSKKTWPILGATYVLAGAAHFALPEGFDAMVPHQNAFGGIWKLPGSKRFHVNWTGVCEILGGLGTLSLLFDSDSSLGKASAFGLFALTIAVTPANTYMFTNNSPGPLPPDATEEMMVLSPSQHFARGVLQVFLLTMLWGIATG